MSSSTIAPRNWLRTCSPRSATSSDAARIASEPRRSSSPTAGPNRVGNMTRQPSGSVVIPFITALARIALRCGGSRQGIGGPCHERVGLDPGVHDRPPVTGRILEPHRGSSKRDEHDLRERREPIDRPMRIVDAGDLVDGPVDGGHDDPPGARRAGPLATSLQPFAPRRRRDPSRRSTRRRSPRRARRARVGVKGASDGRLDGAGRGHVASLRPGAMIGGARSRVAIPARDCSPGLPAGGCSSSAAPGGPRISARRSRLAGADR